MAKTKAADIANTVVSVAVGAFFIILLLQFLPRLVNSMALANAKVGAEYSPSAARDRVAARLINRGGDIGVGMLDRWGASLLNLGGGDEQE